MRAPTAAAALPPANATDRDGDPLVPLLPSAAAAPMSASSGCCASNVTAFAQRRSMPSPHSDLPPNGDGDGDGVSTVNGAAGSSSAWDVGGAVTSSRTLRGGLATEIPNDDSFHLDSPAPPSQPVRRDRTTVAARGLSSIADDAGIFSLSSAGDGDSFTVSGDLHRFDSQPRRAFVIAAAASTSETVSFNLVTPSATKPPPPK